MDDHWALSGASRVSLLGRPGSRGSALLGYSNRRLDWDAAAVGCKSEHMTDVVCTPPPQWPSPAVSTDVGGFMLLVFTEDDAPTWEVRRNAEEGRRWQQRSGGWRHRRHVRSG